MEGEIIEYKGKKVRVIEVVDNETHEEIDFERWQNERLCMKAVKEDGDALRYVKEQSEAVCMEAVKEDGDALQYVKDKKTFTKIIELRKSKESMNEVNDEMSECPEKDDEVMHQVNIALTFMAAANGLRKYEEKGG